MRRRRQLRRLWPDPHPGDAHVRGGRHRAARRFAGIVEPNAWPNARIRMTYPATGAPTVVACSTDNFAIRPASFGGVTVSDADSVTAGTARALTNTAASGGNVHKAGQPFRIAATAFNAAGAATANYAGSPGGQPDRMRAARCGLYARRPRHRHLVCGVRAR